jgi:hypothetical protein
VVVEGIEIEQVLVACENKSREAVGRCLENFEAKEF